MKNVRWYPAWVYDRNMDITRSNMAEYDRQQEKLTARCLEIAPDYFQLDALDRFNVRRRADDEINGRPVRDPIMRRS